MITCFTLYANPATFSSYNEDGMIAGAAMTDPDAMCLNFRKILAEVMQNSEYTWKTLGYLRKLKSKILGFDYAVQ